MLKNMIEYRTILYNNVRFNINKSTGTIMQYKNKIYKKNTILNNTLNVIMIFGIVNLN